LKIDSNPFAKGFRDSSRLTDLERETVEGIMTGVEYSMMMAVANNPHSRLMAPPGIHPSMMLMHPGMVPPFPPPGHLNPNDPASILLMRERTALFGLQQQSLNRPIVPVSSSQQQVYNLLSASFSAPSSSNNPWLNLAAMASAANERDSSPI